MQACSLSHTSNEPVRQELEKLLGRHFGRNRRIRSLRRRQSRYSSSCPIVNLQAEFDTSEKLTLVLKDLSPSSQLEEARRVRPRFLYHPSREIEVYRQVLKPKLFGTAVCYGSVVRENIGCYWLFLERVAGPLLWQVGRFEEWKSAARWLARFHGHFAATNQSTPSELLLYDAAHYTQWIERAEKFALSNRSVGSRSVAGQFKRVVKSYSRVVKHLLALPRTLIHGEFYPSNVIVRRQNSRKQICPIDWEVAALGPGLIDLAALVSGSWDETARKRMVSAYREELAHITGAAPSTPELMESVAHCQLYLAVLWLGWASDWSPPADHEQDWLQEAVRLSHRLG